MIMKNYILLLVVMLHINSDGVEQKNCESFNKKKVNEKGVEAYIKEDSRKCTDIRIDRKSNWISLRLILSVFYFSCFK